MNEFEFADTSLDGMLSFLLFAGALHVDMDRLTKQKWPFALLVTDVDVLSTFVAGNTIYLALI